MAGRGEKGRRGWVICVCLMLVAPLLTAGQDEEGVAEEGFACPMEVELPRFPSAAAALAVQCWKRSGASAARDCNRVLRWRC